MNKTKMAKISLLAMVLALALGFFPAGAMAQSTTNLDVNLQLLGKANVLDLVEVKGTCKAISVTVKVGTVTKALGKPGLANVVNNLKLEVPYEIYWYPKTPDGKVEGKLVADGKVKVKGENEAVTIKYVPAKNPNGPAGWYAVKAKLAVNDKTLDNLNVEAKVKINGPCPGKPGDNNTGNNPGNQPQPGNQPSDNNPGNGNPGNGNPGNGNPGNGNPGNGDSPTGGELPKTATNYPNGMVIGAGVLLAGVALLLIALRKKGWQ